MWDEGWKGEINWGIRVESWWEWKIGEKWELGLGLVGLRWSLTARNEWVAVRRRCPLGTGSQIFVCILILFCKKGVTNPFFYLYDKQTFLTFRGLLFLIFTFLSALELNILVLFLFFSFFWETSLYTILSIS